MRDRTQSAALGTDFTVGPVMPQLLKFFLPFLLANMLNSIYNTVDTIVIGQFVGSSGIVAVTMGGKMLNLFSGIGLALAGGGQVLIAQELGAKKESGVSSTIGTMFSEMTVLSILFAIVTVVFSRQLLQLLHTPAEAFDSALAYLRITCAGLPLIFGYNAVSSVLRGMGDSKKPLLFIAIASVVNLVGDLIFVVFFNMGVAGTAIATVLGQGVSLVLSVVILYRRRVDFRFDFKLRSFAVDWHKLGVMLKIGLPMALRHFFISVTQLYIMSFVNLYSLAEVSAYSVGDKFVHLANMFTMAARQASGAMAGQNIGAEKPERVVSVVNCTALICFGTSAAISALCVLFPGAVFGLFDPSPDVVALAPSFMWISCITFMLSAGITIYDTVITGTGNSLLGLAGGMLDGVIFRLGFSFLFANICHMGVLGFFLGDALARLGPLIIGGIYYYSGAWRRRKRLV